MIIGILSSKQKVLLILSLVYWVELFYWSACWSFLAVLNRFSYFGVNKIPFFEAAVSFLLGPWRYHGPVHADVTELSWLFNQFTSEGSDWASATLSYGPWSVAGLRLRDGVRTSQRLPEGDSLPGSARCWSWRYSPGLRTGTWTFMLGSSIQKWILNLVFGLTARFTQQMAAPRWDSLVGSLTYKHLGL